MSNASVPDKERPGPATLPDPERKKLLCVNCAHHSMQNTSTGFFSNMAHCCGVEKMFDMVDGGPLYRECKIAREHDEICGRFAFKFQPKL